MLGDKLVMGDVDEKFLLLEDFKVVGCITFQRLKRRTKSESAY